MPTVFVHSTVTDGRFRRKFARNLTIAFGKAQLNLRHILIVWRSLDNDSVYFGPVPHSGTTPNAEPAPFVLVTIETDQSRSRDWRGILMKEIRTAAQSQISEEHLFIRIVPVDPSNYWNLALSQQGVDHTEKEE